MRNEDKPRSPADLISSGISGRLARLLLPVLPALLLSAAVPARSGEGSSPSDRSGEGGAAAAGQEPQRWGFVPILMSNAETGVQGGVLVMRFLEAADSLDKPSSIGFAARLSQKGQAQVNLFPEWYLRRNLYHVAGELNFIRWPAEFYGIGNDRDIPKESADAYRAQGVNGNLTAERLWLRNFSAGPVAAFSYEEIESDGANGLLTPAVAGHDGGFVAGLGVQATYDGRDAVYWARRGVFLRSRSLWNRTAWAGGPEKGYDFDSHCLEARAFAPFFETGALGVAATLQLRTGDVPFRELATADGDHALRGLVRGKYRDRDLLLFQAEYKSYLPDWKWLKAGWLRNRLGWAVFAEAGQVAPSPGAFSASEFRSAMGVGLRYAMNPAQRMNIRIDLGIVDGTVAPAINIKEAF